MDQSQCSIALLPHLCSLQASINGSVPCLLPQEVMGPDAMQSIKCMEHSGGARVCLPFHFRPPRPSIGFDPGRRAASAAKRGAGERPKRDQRSNANLQTDAAWRLRTATQQKVGRSAIDRDLCTSPRARDVDLSRFANAGSKREPLPTSRNILGPTCFLAPPVLMTFSCPSTILCQTEH